MHYEARTEGGGEKRKAAAQTDSATSVNERTKLKTTITTTTITPTAATTTPTAPATASQTPAPSPAPASLTTTTSPLAPILAARGDRPGPAPSTECGSTSRSRFNADRMAQLNEAKRAAAAVKQRRVDLATANDTERRRRSGEHRAITDFPTDPPCLSTSSAAAACWSSALPVIHSGTSRGSS